MATVKPAVNFDASKDAEALRKAMKGLGTDEQAIIDILAYRSVSQRKEIAKVFKSSYGEDIYSKLRGELSGNFRDAVLLSFRDKAHVNALALYNAITGAGTNDRVVIQTICASNNEEIEELKKAYEDILKEKKQDPLKRNLEKDVEGDTSGDYKRVLIALLQGQREEKTAAANVATDCEALYTAGEGKVGTDESVFVRILANRSHAHIREINKAYFAAMEHDLIRAIHKETSGNFRDALETIVKTALNKADCIADMLLGSMKGLGTRDDDLIRLVLAYSEDNLAEVKQVFAAKNGKTLAEYIRGETSGDYKKFLLAIVGK
ncbi:Annexin A6 [Sparganum proliferum]